MLNKIKLVDIKFGPQHNTAQDVLLLLLSILGIEVIDVVYLRNIDEIVIVYVNEYNVFWGITRDSFHVKLSAVEFF